jgi:plasmid stabilization system protein ParE
MGPHVSIRAKSDLDDIWEYLYQQSGSNDVADGQIDAITNRFYLLSRRHALAVHETVIWAPAQEVFPSGDIFVYRIVGQDVLILRVAHNSRDLRALLYD